MPSTAPPTSAICPTRRPPAPSTLPFLSTSIPVPIVAVLRLAKPAVALARSALGAPGLDFAGLMSFTGNALDADLNSSAAESRPRVQMLLDTRQAVEKAGMEVRVVSAGGTNDYELVGDMAGVTEVRAGSYALMDGRHRERCPHLRPAAHIMATVISRPESTLAITDGGVKATGMDAGEPSLARIGGASDAVLANATAGFAGAEHGMLALQGAAEAGVQVGDKVWVIPADIGTCANLHDYFYAGSDGRLEAVWEIAARGFYR